MPLLRSSHPVPAVDSADDRDRHEPEQVAEPISPHHQEGHAARTVTTRVAAMTVTKDHSRLPERGDRDRGGDGGDTAAGAGCRAAIARGNRPASEVGRRRARPPQGTG